MDRVEYWKALKIIGNLVSELPNEVVNLPKSMWRVAAEDVVAKNDVPRRSKAVMDGYAVAGPVRQGETFRVSTRNKVARREEAVPIRTGLEMPEGTDTVVPVEATKRIRDNIVVTKNLHKGYGVLNSGAEIRRGEVILPKGHVIRPEFLKVLFEAGIESVVVKKCPRVAIIPTGDEFVYGNVLETTGKMVTNVIGSLSAESVYVDPAPDDVDELSRAITNTLDSVDVVVLVGGSALSRKDVSWLTHELMPNAVKGFRGVKIHPGKSSSMFMVGRKPVVNVPGFPAAAFVGTLFLVGPVLKKLLGIPPSPVLNPLRVVKVVGGYSAKAFEGFVKVAFLKSLSLRDAVIVNPGRQRISVLAKADGFTILSPEKNVVKEGEEVVMYSTRFLTLTPPLQYNIA